MKRMSGDKIVRALGNIRKAVQELEDAFFEDQPKGDGDPADGMDEGSVGPMRAGFTTSASPHPLAFGQRFKGPLKRFRERIVQEAVENGIPESEAVETVAAIGDGRILELLLKYGPEIIKIIMALFGK
jgi:hypothetical protein